MSGDYHSQEEIPTKKQYADFDRWVCTVDNRVWERRSWGWKFIGVAKSQNPLHLMEVISTDADHPSDILDNVFNTSYDKEIDG